MGMHEYLKSLSDLEMINRAPGYFKFEEHNVAAHSFKVTQAAQMLGDYMKKLLITTIQSALLVISKRR